MTVQVTGRAREDQGPDFRRPPSLSAGTRQTASATIAALIFDRPSVRSRKVIGISTTFSPAETARQVNSTWNEYPVEPTESRSTRLRASLRQHLKPPVRSFWGRPSTVAE